MADFSKICQESLESVKQFLEEANANTPEVNQRLERLNEVANFIQLDPRWRGKSQPEVARVNEKPLQKTSVWWLDEVDYDNGLSLKFSQWGRNPTESWWNN